MFRKALAALFSGIIITLSLSPLASADEGGDAVPMADVYYTQYSVINKSTVSTNWTNRSQVIGSCKVSRSGTSCTISSGTTATVTVATSLGASKALVSGSLGLSAGKSITVNTSCTSPNLSAGETFRAAAVGTRYQYKVRKVTRMDGRVVTDQTSGWLYAFKPNSSRIHCGV